MSRQLWWIVLVAILGCSKAELPLESETPEETPRQNTVLKITTIRADGAPVDSAEVYLNGELLGKTPLEQSDVPTGLMTLRISREGYEVYSEQIELVEGQVHSLEVILEPLASPPELSFDVLVDSVIFGEPVPITWASDGYQVIIDHGVGVRGPVGNEEISFKNPGKRFITATAYGVANLTTVRGDSVTVHPAPLPPLPVLILSTTRFVCVDSTATISWYTQNADYVVIDYVGQAAPHGSLELSFSTPGIRIVTATAFNSAGYVTASDTIEVVTAEDVVSVEDIVVPATVDVRADKGPEGYADRGAGSFYVQQSGRYQVLAEVWYNSGDDQENESFYLEIRDERGVTTGPLDANAGVYKVVPDDPGEPHMKTQNCGTFHLPEGQHFIDVYHYAKIAEAYAQFLNGPIDGPESVKILGFKLVYVDE